jgi:hypothetical protein
MSAQHRLDLAEPGTFMGARVICLGGPADMCQQWCAEGCEEQCYETPILSGAQIELVAQAPIDGHRWEPTGSCGIADWLDAGDLAETYTGDDDIWQWDDDGETQPGIRSGLIDVSWDGEDYLWDYAEPAPQSGRAA